MKALFFLILSIFVICLCSCADKNRGDVLNTDVAPTDDISAETTPLETVTAAEPAAVAVTAEEFRDDIPKNSLEHIYLSDTEIYDKEDIIIELNPEKLTRISAEYTVTNNTESEIFFDEDVTIEVKKDGEWYGLMGNPVNGPMENFGVQPSESYPAKGYWRSLYGQLPTGEYRMIVRVHLGDLGAEVVRAAAEFTLM